MQNPLDLTWRIRTIDAALYGLRETGAGRLIRIVCDTLAFKIAREEKAGGSTVTIPAPRLPKELRRLLRDALTQAGYDVWYGSRLTVNW